MANLAQEIEALDFNRDATEMNEKYRAFYLHDILPSGEIRKIQRDHLEYANAYSEKVSDIVAGCSLVVFQWDSETRERKNRR